MRQFVSDDDADAAKVYGVICIWIEERRLQNAGREVDRVLQRAVIRIHGRRCHAPFHPIARFADLIHVVMRRKFAGTKCVAGVVAAFDDERGVVAPFVGIADLVEDRFQFDMRLLLGLFRHPVERGDVFVERLFERMHEIEHSLLR